VKNSGLLGIATSTDNKYSGVVLDNSATKERTLGIYQ